MSFDFSSIIHLAGGGGGTGSTIGAISGGAALGAIGIPPPLSTGIGGAVGSLIDKFTGAGNQGGQTVWIPIDKYYPTGLLYGKKAVTEPTNGNWLASYAKGIEAAGVSYAKIMANMTAMSASELKTITDKHWQNNVNYYTALQNWSPQAADGSNYDPSKASESSSTSPIIYLAVAFIAAKLFKIF